MICNSIIINFFISYLITEILDTDLRKVLEREHDKLTEEHFKLFLYQILRGVKYMHSGNILHRDLVFYILLT